MIGSSPIEKVISSPHTHLLVPELQTGSVVKIPVTTANGQCYDKLWCQSGDKATVYKFQLNDHYKALRCFHAPVDADMHRRYELLSRYVDDHPQLGTFLASFTYYPEGILIPQQLHDQYEQKKSSIVVMDWVEGDTLLARVHELCMQRDQQALARLAEQWYDLLVCMDALECAHGDLAGDQVLVRRQDGQLVLIDYDTFYVPPCHGWQVSLAVHPDYQHPDLEKRSFGARMDDFSRHVIYVALSALQRKPDLWHRYGVCGPEGNDYDIQLLFSAEDDFHNPESSALFADLETIDDPLLQREIQLLKVACTLPLEEVRLPPLPLHEKSGYSITASKGPRVSDTSETSSISSRIDLESGEIVVCWEWPADTSIQFVAVAWRPDRWPTTPQEVDTYLYHPVRRCDASSQGVFRFHAPEHASFYIQVYVATPTTPPLKEPFSRPTWSYAPLISASRKVLRR